MKKLRIPMIPAVVVMFAMALPARAQTVLTLEECREMAVENNNSLKVSQEKVDIAGYEKKAAFSNYLPKISAQGTYMYMGRTIQLVSDGQLAMLGSAGTMVQNSLDATVAQLVQNMMQNPTVFTNEVVQQVMQEMFKTFGNTGLEESLNAIGTEVGEALKLDNHNIYAAMVSVEEPLYAGGKVRAYHQITKYAEELAKTQMTAEEQEVILTTDKAYWQIVSLANKLKLTENYVEMLRKMSSDVDKLVNEGMATESDRLAIKVKLNDAELTLIKVNNGLALSKMLLCQTCGLPLDTELSLADESLDDVVIPNFETAYTEEDVLRDRPELYCLDMAVKISDKKVNIARSEFLPTVAAIGGVVVTNPSFFNGVQEQFQGFVNVGVVARVPIFHFGEGMNKIRKAQSEANIARITLEDTKQKIMLQVKQYEMQIKEAESRMRLTSDKMSDAEENLRIADIGFREGIVPSSTLDSAQTSWMQAHSEYIDAKIDVIMANTYFKKSIGKLSK
ncbi:MAG: TolC family protein [Candidatus Limimorpha sp.]